MYTIFASPISISISAVHSIRRANFFVSRTNFLELASAEFYIPKALKPKSYTLSPKP